MQQFRCLFRIKGDGRISRPALSHQNCKGQINVNQDHLHLISEPGSGRRRDHRGSDYKAQIQFRLLSALPMQRKRRGGEGGAALLPWRKCRHGGSALTLLTCRFPNTRLFWTADLNITAQRGRNGSSGAFFIPPTLPTKHRKDVQRQNLKVAFSFNRNWRI